MGRGKVLKSVFGETLGCWDFGVRSGVEERAKVTFLEDSGVWSVGAFSLLLVSWNGWRVGVYHI